MMKWLAGLAVFLIAACVAISPFERVQPEASVHIIGSYYTCTGFHIGEGRVLTVAHCVGSGLFIDGEAAILIKKNQAIDTALYQVDHLIDKPAARLACRAPKIGERVMMVGEVTDIFGIYTFGRIASAEQNIKNRKGGVMVDISVGPGSSGAPLFLPNGSVIAMVSAFTMPHANLAFMISAKNICNWLEEG